MPLKGFFLEEKIFGQNAYHQHLLASIDLMVAAPGKRGNEMRIIKWFFTKMHPHDAFH